MTFREFIEGLTIPIYIDITYMFEDQNIMSHDLERLLQNYNKNIVGSNQMAVSNGYIDYSVELSNAFIKFAEYSNLDIDFPIWEPKNVSKERIENIIPEPIVTKPISLF